MPSAATSMTANELWNEITVRESDQHTATSQAIAPVPHGAGTASQDIPSPTLGPISQPVLVATSLLPTSVTTGSTPIFKSAKTNEK